MADGMEFGYSKLDMVVAELAAGEGT
jgi:hypothetical protein